LEKIETVLIIPSLNPDKTLLQVVDSALAAGFVHAVVVNDGSDNAHTPIFAQIAALRGCSVLHHEENKGKGAALKTAFAYCLAHFEKAPGVVTADGDGQHKTADICTCARRMEQQHKIIFGVRDFSLPDVPPKSRFGNRLTSFVFRTGCGLRLSDTQTGLRAIPTEYLDRFCRTRGDRFEYETQMLLDLCRDCIPYEEQTIETVYEGGNSGTHFRPLRDSVSIYFQILKFFSASLLSTGAEWLCNFLLLHLLLHTAVPAHLHIWLAGGISRACSSALNLTLNKKLVFSCRSGWGTTVLRYYALCIPQTVLTLLCTKGISQLLKTTSPALNTLALALVSTVFFFLSYSIQKNWVFKKEKSAPRA